MKVVTGDTLIELYPARGSDSVWCNVGGDWQPEIRLDFWALVHCDRIGDKRLVPVVVNRLDRPFAGDRMAVGTLIDATSLPGFHHVGDMA